MWHDSSVIPGGSASLFVNAECALFISHGGDILILCLACGIFVLILNLALKFASVVIIN